MKTTKIEHLHRSQIIELSLKLFDFIELTYGISRADDRFANYFVNHVNQYYKHLTFEDIESAFERNSSGLLDLYLPKISGRPDNKVIKFNIPDLTKIINAYCRFTGIEKSSNEQEKKVFSLEEKKQIRKEWCNQLIQIFEDYKNKNERASIRVPIYTCKVLVKFGIIEEKEIDFSERKMNIMIKSRTKNEDFIFKAFDLIINQGMHIKDFIGNFYHYEDNEINIEKMPF